MKRVAYHKSILVFALTALLFLAGALLGLGVNTTQRAIAAQSDYVLDANRLSFEGRIDTAKKDTDNLLNAGKDNYTIQTHVDHTKPSAKLIASGYADQIYGGNNDALRIEIRLMFNRWPDLGYGGFSSDATYISFGIYSSADTAFENPIATSTQYGTIGNFVRTFQLSPESVCNYRGKLQDFVLRVDSDATSWASAIIVDYVKIVFEQKDILLAGEAVVGANPENVADENVVWTEAEGYSATYIDHANYGGFYAYVDNPALVELRKEKFPDAECVAAADGTETLFLKNVVFPLNVGKINPDGYEQFMMDILLTDKNAQGDHTLYLYGGKTENFVDANGNPVGYAAKVTIASYEQGFHNKFILEQEDMKALAGADGMISTIYVLYHGNTLDTATEKVGLRNGSQIWINKIQFLMADEVETPTIGTEYDSYDLAELFPVGQNVNIVNKAATQGNVVSNAMLVNKSVGELSFSVNLEKGENIAFLLYAKGRKQVNEYADGGILFSLSNEQVEISTHRSGAETKSVSMAATNTFNGEKKVKIECIPYYMNALEAGYYCAVWVDGEKILQDYFSNDELDLGNAFHMCYTAQEKDFSVTVGAVNKESAISAKDLMNVQIRAEKIVYSHDRTDIPLALYWYNTGFDQISEVECVGDDAWVNQETKRVQFTENGEVKLKFSVTNVFGTFESGEMVLACEDVVMTQNEKNGADTSKKGCSSAVNFLPIAALALGGIFAMTKAKFTKKSEELSEE